MPYNPQGVAGGIRKLSELEIDIDKDWLGFGISNLKEIVAAMITGDLAVHNGAKLIRFAAGQANYVVTSQGPGKLPVWAPGGSYYNRYFPVSIDCSHAEAVVTPQQIARTVAFATSLNYPGATKQPAMSLAGAMAVVTPVNVGKTAAIATAHPNELLHLLSGAVADDGGAQTDETTAANNDTTNDMTLLPATPAINDAYYFGWSTGTFPKMRLIVSTAGAGVWNFAWEYWDGTGWSSLPGMVDPTNSFRVSGTHKLSWTVPGDWAITTIMTINAYWIRARVSDYTSITTQPKGQRAWIITNV